MDLSGYHRTAEGQRGGGRRGRGSAGFTLVELLMAVTIFAIVAAGVYQALSTGLSARRRGEDALERHRRAQMALDRVADDLRNMVSYGPEPFRGEADGLRFPALLAGPGAFEAGLEVCLIAYAVTEEGVVRTVRSIGGGASSRDELLPPSWEVGFQYLRTHAEGGEEEWTTEWENAWGIPEAVQITLKQADRPAVFTRTVGLPWGGPQGNRDRRP
ncbi:MAG: hypothetical protein A3F84_06415 [Candidatus Handelsmanbacteria bacterium RIFCSPLOWO2_12_FULL_64_10]|uniref:Type II secretion system protein J n=1 Tax=Handelsmanbacteria sp. (strain RIFCSPLOWO2_12_FULL_64_10) TaxID=1817868 RepID=A0A1F6CRS0_HANXR|nr:MAG: hypothetical protein A3F84_06415 [Candidatus Handelsmanbacteria bacterium RIFCSPLOWO2_12_FULL_64_10]